MDEHGAANTDRELWRESDSYYADSIHVTADGGIGINCGGHVFVKPLREWHALALAAKRHSQIARPLADVVNSFCPPKVDAAKK